MTNVDLWIEILELLDASVASYEWIKVPSHMQLEGNKRAHALAEVGWKSSPSTPGLDDSHMSYSHSWRLRCRVTLGSHPWLTQHLL